MVAGKGRRYDTERQWNVKQGAQSIQIWIWSNPMSFFVVVGGKLVGGVIDATTNLNQPDQNHIPFISMMTFLPLLHERFCRETSDSIERVHPKTPSKYTGWIFPTVYTHLYASSTLKFMCFMMYAMATVGDREIPARQWTITQPLADRTFSVVKERHQHCHTSILKDKHSLSIFNLKAAFQDKNTLLIFNLKTAFKN